MNGATQDSLRLTITVPDSVRTGESVPIVLAVTNVSGRALNLYLRGREPTAEVIVRDANGGLMWRNLEGQMIPAILQLKPLAVGESFSIRVVWQRGAGREAVVPGDYLVEAELLTEGPPFRFTPARFSIVP